MYHAPYPQPPAYGYPPGPPQGYPPMGHPQETQHINSILYSAVGQILQANAARIPRDAHNFLLDLLHPSNPNGAATAQDLIAHVASVLPDLFRNQNGVGQQAVINAVSPWVTVQINNIIGRMQAQQQQQAMYAAQSYAHPSPGMMGGTPMSNNPMWPEPQGQSQQVQHQPQRPASQPQQTQPVPTVPKPKKASPLMQPITSLRSVPPSDFEKRLPNWASATYVTIGGEDVKSVVSAIDIKVPFDNAYRLVQLVTTHPQFSELRRPTGHWTMVLRYPHLQVLPGISLDVFNDIKNAVAGKEDDIFDLLETIKGPLTDHQWLAFEKIVLRRVNDRMRRELRWRQDFEEILQLENMEGDVAEVTSPTFADGIASHRGYPAKIREILKESLDEILNADAIHPENDPEKLLAIDAVQFYYNNHTKYDLANSSLAAADRETIIKGLNDLSFTVIERHRYVVVTNMISQDAIAHSLRNNLLTPDQTPLYSTAIGSLHQAGSALFRTVGEIVTSIGVVEEGYALVGATPASEFIAPFTPLFTLDSEPFVGPANKSLGFGF